MKKIEELSNKLFESNEDGNRKKEVIEKLEGEKENLQAALKSAELDGKKKKENI